MDKYIKHLNDLTELEWSYPKATLKEIVLRVVDQRNSAEFISNKLIILQNIGIPYEIIYSDSALTIISVKLSDIKQHFRNKVINEIINEL